MPSIVLCNSIDCMFNDDGQCDVDKLAIVDGVCTGSPRHGRNVSENDLDEQLKAENAQLKAKADAQLSHIKKLQAELSHCIEKSNRDYDRDLDRMRMLATENAKLRELVNSYADLFEKEAATNNGHGPYYSGEDWLVLANDMRVELAKCCGELGIEVE